MKVVGKEGGRDRSVEGSGGGVVLVSLPVRCYKVTFCAPLSFLSISIPPTLHPSLLLSVIYALSIPE